MSLFSQRSLHLIDRFSRKLHSKANRTHRGTDPNTASNDDELSVRSLDPSMESRRTTIDNSSSPSDGNNRDKKAYLKSLERSLRTGRQIKDENDDDDQSHSIPSKYIRHCLNKYIRRTGRNSLETTEL